MNNQIWLRFHSGHGLFPTGEILVKPSKDKIIKMYTKPVRLLEVRNNEIIVNCYYDAGFEEGTQLLQIVCYDDDKIRVIPQVKGILQYRHKRNWFGRQTESRTQMNEFTGYDIPVSTNRVTNGVTIPYNSFSVQRISLLDDLRVKEDTKNSLRRTNTSLSV